MRRYKIGSGTYMEESKPTTVVPEIRLHAKRLALLAGDSAGQYYLRTKGLTEEQANAVMQRDIWENDTNRDDVKLSKCMHCMFRRCCIMSPTTCDCMIDDRTPIWKIKFSIRAVDRPSCSYVKTYERGWAEIVKPDRSVEIVQMAPDNFVIAPGAAGNDLHKIFFRWGESAIVMGNSEPDRLIISGVLPLKGETYDAYKMRISDIIKRIASHVKVKEDPKERLKAIFNQLGQGKLLNEMYGGDAEAMAADYFPYKKVEEIIAEFTFTSAAKDEDIRKQAIEDQKARRRADG